MRGVTTELPKGIASLRIERPPVNGIEAALADGEVASFLERAAHGARLSR
jgi:hypothetical protein